MVAPPNHNRAPCHSLVVEKTPVSGPLIGEEETALLIAKSGVVARHIGVPCNAQVIVGIAPNPIIFLFDREPLSSQWSTDPDQHGDGIAQLGWEEMSTNERLRLRLRFRSTV